jgi:murein DD-endopeptidase MepM/ murein hydrolase activator NlpD
MSRASAFRSLAVLLIALAAPAAPAAEPADGYWAWPVADARAILRTYQAPATRYGAGHRGVDIRATGDVRAPDNAVVRFAGVVVNRPVVSLTHGNGLVSSFEPVASTLTSGEAVTRGEIIGTVAEYTVSAHCEAQCLHIGVRRGDEYLSPLALFGEIPAAVLLPPGSGAP